jgi:hypothetical protein
MSLFLLAVALLFINRAVAVADEKPAITVVLPSTDEGFKDLKFVFDLDQDEKGYTTLKETIELFLEGVEKTTPSGIRIYPTANGLRSVLSFPVSIMADPLKYDLNGKKLTDPEIKKRWPNLNKLPAAEVQKLREVELKKLTPAEIQKLKEDSAFTELIDSLWNLDVKTAPAPSPQLDKQIPKATKQKLPTLGLAKNERVIFGLSDGFMRYESGYVHVGQLLPDVRLAKGGPPQEIAKGHDLGVLIDGLAQSKEERQKAFEKSKKELIGAIEKGEKESEAAFEFRKAVTEHQIAEIERFFVEASRIHAVWNVSETEKNARFELDLEGLEGTSLEQSVLLLGQTPDEFAGVSKTEAVLSLSGSTTLDPMRNAFLKNIAKLERTLLKKEVADNAKLSADQKAIDGDLVDLTFDVIDGIVNGGVVNGFLRSWSNADGTLTTVGGGRIPEGARAKVEKMLEKFAARGPNNKLDSKVDSEGEIEIHKLTLADVQQDFPEIIGKDGAVYVGVDERSLWLASGDKSLDRMKQAILEAKSAGPKPGPDMELFVKLGPFVDFWNNWRTRNPKAPATPPAIETKRPKETKATRTSARVEKKPVEGLISTADLRKLAIEAFQKGNDTMTMSLERQDKVAKLKVQYDEGILRFVGKVASKFVKENLEDE